MPTAVAPNRGMGSDLGAAIGAGTAPPEWVHLLPIGSWDRGDEAPWVITAETCRQMVENFTAGVMGRVLPLDLNHDPGPAPGWITAVETRDDGLWGLVEWNDFGRQLLADRRYRYVSAEWWWTWKRPSDGAVFNNVLSGLALTNKPHFKELPAVAAGDGGSPMSENANPNGTPTPQPPDPQPNQAAPGAPQQPDAQAQMETLRAELASVREAREQQAAQIAALERREQRMRIVQELREMPHPSNERARMAPQLAEQIADVLADYSDEVRPVQGEEASKARSPRQRVRELFVACAQPWPEVGERGFTGSPASGEGMSTEQKYAELDRLTQARATELKCEYREALRAVAKERPDLVG